MYVDNPEKLVADLIQEAKQPTFGDEFEEPYNIEQAVQDMAHDYATELYQRTTEASVGFAERSLYMLGLLHKTLDPIVDAEKLDPYLANVFIYAAVGTLYDMIQSEICNAFKTFDFAE